MADLNTSWTFPVDDSALTELLDLNLDRADTKTGPPQSPEADLVVEDVDAEHDPHRIVATVHEKEAPTASRGGYSLGLGSRAYDDDHNVGFSQPPQQASPKVNVLNLTISGVDALHTSASHGRQPIISHVVSPSEWKDERKREWDPARRPVQSLGMSVRRIHGSPQPTKGSSTPVAIRVPTSHHPAVQVRGASAPRSSVDYRVPSRLWKPNNRARPASASLTRRDDSKTSEKENAARKGHAAGSSRTVRRMKRRPASANPRGRARKASDSKAKAKAKAKPFVAGGSSRVSVGGAGMGQKSLREIYGNSHKKKRPGSGRKASVSPQGGHGSARPKPKNQGLVPRSLVRRQRPSSARPANRRAFPPDTSHLTGTNPVTQQADSPRGGGSPAKESLFVTAQPVIVVRPLSAAESPESPSAEQSPAVRLPSPPPATVGSVITTEKSTREFSRHQSEAILGVSQHPSMRASSSSHALHEQFSWVRTTTAGAQQHRMALRERVSSSRASASSSTTDKARQTNRANSVAPDNWLAPSQRRVKARPKSASKRRQERHSDRAQSKATKLLEHARAKLASHANEVYTKARLEEVQRTYEETIAKLLENHASRERDLQARREQEVQKLQHKYDTERIEWMAIRSTLQQQLGVIPKLEQENQQLQMLLAEAQETVAAQKQNIQRLQRKLKTHQLLRGGAAASEQRVERNDADIGDTSDNQVDSVDQTEQSSPPSASGQ